ncbi:zinc finger protein 236 [Folsomia candida]|nr:zinc finger protein 236 [Folsomia candida]XP_021950622.1 zinc finger protein 236 [Folsomia candida]OXA56911.1 Zinc finger protein with KRAB and SCAN domains 8 [Folsomia candida]
MPLGEEEEGRGGHAFGGLVRLKEELERGSDEENEVAAVNDIDDDDDEPTVFPCNVCSATFVTRMSLIRHMILHEDDSQGNNDNQQQLAESTLPPTSSSSAVVTTTNRHHIPSHNLLEAILKNGSQSFLPLLNGSSNSSNSNFNNNNGGQNMNRVLNGKRSHSERPIPNLKPLPSLIQINNKPTQQQQEKNFQCQLCGVWFWKKEDLSRHVTRTHGSAKFTCPYCHRNISRRDHLKRHIKNVHPEFCTATEVGPFVNQGAGRPPKQPREMLGTIDDLLSPLAPPPERKKPRRNSTDSKFSINEIPTLQSLQADIGNQIRMINSSKIEPSSTSDDEDNDYEEDEINPETKFSFDNNNLDYNTHEADGEELFEEDENEEFCNKEMQDIIKPEVHSYMEEDYGEEEEDEEQNYDDDDGDVDDDLNDMSGMASGGMMSDEYGNHINSENENTTEENGDGAFELEVQRTIGGPSERKFKCELCDAAFMSKINMQRHMSTHSVARPHKCSVCGKGFLRKEHLTKHLSSVHSGLKYRCQFCRKDISRKDHLLRHIRNCHPTEFMGMSLDMIDSEPQISQVPAVTLSDNPNMRVAALSCDMCSEIFNHIDELMEHQSDAHSDIRKFKCDLCPKSFKRKEHLVKHMTTHAPPVAKTYSCSECSTVFPSLEIAHAHLRQAHHHPTKKSTNQKKTSSNSNGFAGSSAAGGQTSLPCNLCDNTFQQRAHLLQHLKAYHGVSNPERRFTDAAFPTPGTTANSNPIDEMMTPPSATPRQMVTNNHNKFKQFPLSGSLLHKSFGKPQIRSLIGFQNTMQCKNDEGSLESLMGLINRGSISLSLSKVEK